MIGSQESCIPCCLNRQPLGIHEGLGFIECLHQLGVGGCCSQCRLNSCTIGIHPELGEHGLRICSSGFCAKQLNFRRAGECLQGGDLGLLLGNRCWIAQCQQLSLRQGQDGVDAGGGICGAGSSSGGIDRGISNRQGVDGRQLRCCGEGRLGINHTALQFRDGGLQGRSSISSKRQIGEGSCRCSLKIGEGCECHGCGSAPLKSRLWQCLRRQCSRSFVMSTSSTGN